MCFNCIHSPPTPSSPIFPSIPTQHVSPPLTPAQSSRICADRKYVFGYMLFRWTMVVNVSGPTLLEKSDSPFPSGYQWPIAPWLGVGLGVYLPSPCWDLFWLVNAVTVAEFMCVAVPLCLLDTLSVYPSTTSGSYRLPPLSSVVIIEPWEEGMWERGPIYDSAICSLSLSVPWPVVGLCVNPHLLRKEWKHL